MLFDLVRIGHALRGLGCALQAFQVFQRLNHQRTAGHGQAVMQTGRGVMRQNRLGVHGQHVAGVQARIHLHQRDARVGVAGLNGPVNRCRTAPARQQGCMDVEAAMSWHIQHPLRQDQTVGGHHHRIGLGRLQCGLRHARVFGIFAIASQTPGLTDGKAVTLRPLFDGRGLQLHAASRRAIGLSQHQHHLMARGMELGQGLASELRRAGKNQAHGLQRSARCALSILVLIRLRLRGDRYSTKTLPKRWSISC